jgi:tetrahydromethanopterin S-methyltransferase subunit G
MKTINLLKLVYISKRMSIGVYGSIVGLDPVEGKAERIEEFMREEGKHTMMAVKRLDELGLETPKRSGEIAERFGASIGKAAGILGWKGVCLFMKMGEEAERLFLEAASRFCRNKDDREILNLIIFDEKKHGEWWKNSLFQGRHH